VITGGSRGLGRSMALHLAEKGVNVVITYREAEAQATDVIRAIEAAGAKGAALRLDVAESASFDAFASTLRNVLKERFASERFDYLVNNAGTGAHASFEQTSEAQFDDLMKIHLKAPFFLTQKLLPLLADGGRVLNISSGLARFTFVGSAAYATMKGGVEVLTRYLAKELAPRKITVNVLAPGAIETDFGGGRVRDNADLNRGIAAQTALGRVGLPDDIGSAVSLLLSKDSGWITGQRIEASGGMLL